MGLVGNLSQVQTYTLLDAKEECDTYNLAISCELGRGSTMSITEEIEKKFVDTLALLVYRSKLFPQRVSTELRLGGWIC
jgi:hypothetical protein